MPELNLSGRGASGGADGPAHGGRQFALADRVQAPAAGDPYSAAADWTLSWSCSISNGSAGETWANLAKL